MSKTLFLVEDDPLFVEFITQSVALLEGDWQVVVCQTGCEALDAVAAGAPRFDLALVDLGLPDLDGVEVIRALAQQLPILPILVVSVARSPGRLLDAIRAGAQGYVVKGDTELTVTRAVEQVLQGIYPISPLLAQYLVRMAVNPDEAGPTGEPTDLLSKRQWEVLRRFAEGESYAEVAAGMGLSLATVQMHVRGLYKKLRVNSRAKAVIKARSQGLL
jgi:two-component system nitrate/nitrite response regulator NarL